MRCFAGFPCPIKADKSDRIRCAETSAAPTRHGVPVAYIEATTKLSSGRPLGATLAAAIVPMPLTPMSFSPSSLIGGTCRNHSTST